MKKIFSLLSSLILIFPLVSLAQKSLPELTPANISDITDYVSKNYNLNNKVTDTLCLCTTVFARFKVAENGKIEELLLTPGTPSIIKDELEKAIKSSNGHWSKKETDRDYFNKKTFILPIVLFYMSGCEEGNKELELNITAERRAREYRKIDSTLRNANYAVRNILSSEGTQLGSLECVIISPVSFGVQ